MDLSPHCSASLHGQCPGYFKVTHRCRCGCHVLDLRDVNAAGSAAYIDWDAMDAHVCPTCGRDEYGEQFRDSRPAAKSPQTLTTVNVYAPKAWCERCDDWTYSHPCSESH